MKISADKIRSVIKKADVDQKGTAFANDVPLRDQGLDSLDTFTIYLAIEEALNVTIPDDDLSRLQSIDDIVQYLNQVHSPSGASRK